MDIRIIPKNQQSGPKVGRTTTFAPSWSRSQLVSFSIFFPYGTISHTNFITDASMLTVAHLLQCRYSTGNSIVSKFWILSVIHLCYASCFTKPHLTLPTTALASNWKKARAFNRRPTPPLFKAAKNSNSCRTSHFPTTLSPFGRLFRCTCMMHALLLISILCSLFSCYRYGKLAEEVASYSLGENARW